MDNSVFAVDARLTGDTFPVIEWPLSRVLLMNDARFPWVILVPRRVNAVEAFELTRADQAALWNETATAARRLKAMTGAKKINIGALGNIVAQLHVHVVARFEGDAAWPGPVWGSGQRVPYEVAALRAMVSRLQTELHAGPD